MSSCSRSSTRPTAIDGATAPGLFRYITLPLVKPFTIIITLLSLEASLHVFDLVQTMTGPADRSIPVRYWRSTSTGGPSRPRSPGSATPPFLWMISASLKSSIGVFQQGLNIIPKSPVWSNYDRAWNTAHFGDYLRHTVMVTAASVAIAVVRSSMAGYALARYRYCYRYCFRGRKVVPGVLIATLFVPAGYTIIPVVDIAQRLHLFNSLAGMILAISGGAHVVLTLLYFGYFHRIPRELTESALVDGAGFFTIFFRIMLPLAMPVTATATLLTFPHTWNAFFLPLVFSFSRPDHFAGAIKS